MGSFGTWVECYWCERWTWDPYIIDCIGHPLCEDCEDHFWLFDAPPSPNAVDHRTNVLMALIRPLNGDPHLARRIAEFLTDWYRPGEGSLQQSRAAAPAQGMIRASGGIAIQPL